MDLELREGLALDADRARAIAQLLPGSEDHDYYRCLHAQHAGALDEADRLLDAWPHGDGERVRRLRLRQLVCRATEPGLADLPRVADHLRDHFGVHHGHEAEVEQIAPDRATRLPDGALDAARVLDDAVARDAALGQVTDEGLLELLARRLDPARRRALLGRLGHTADPALVRLVADDLAAQRDATFGNLAIHQQLTLDQLHELARLRPALRSHLAWVSAVLARFAPPASLADLAHDLDARRAHLEQCWGFVAELPPALNSLRAHVLWHLLDTRRRLGLAPDLALIASYLALPRRARYVPRGWLDAVDRGDVAVLGQDYRAVTGLPPAGDDEQLVRALLHDPLDPARPDGERVLDRAAELERWFDRVWLEGELAAAVLLYGRDGADRATLVLGPARAAELRERVELAWCAHVPTRFAVDEPVVLEADVKHVPELVVKVFRIDPLAYFRHARRAVGPDLDLDGLAASHELVLRFDEPAVRRVRRRVELPMCARAGTYVIDLIGNGMSSRAVITKGRLRHLTRLGAAGHVVTIVDDAGRPRPDARAWLGDREYVPDERGAFVVPFSTAPGKTPVLLFAGDVATVGELVLARETYALATTVLLDRQGLLAGRTARAIVRARLTVGGAPASVTLLERATCELVLTDLRGVATTEARPLALSDDDAAVIEWPLGDDTARVELRVRGVVQVRSEQREHELSDQRTFEIGTIRRTTAIADVHLARTAGGFVVSVLGASGEPAARRPITIGLTHRWSRLRYDFELATDAAGRVELGALPGVSRIDATAGGARRSWWIEDALGELALTVAAGADVAIPLPPSQTAAAAARRMSLVELAGGAPKAHPRVDLELLEDTLVIRGLPAGEYALRAPGLGGAAITVLDVRAELRGVAFTAHEVGELTRTAPAIEALATDDGVRVVLRAPGPRTRVHVLATRFAPAPLELPWIGPRPAGRRTDRPARAHFESGRELGDEYRYVLDRRRAAKYPGLLLDRPGLLLNPWARRTTTTDVATARPGSAFGAAPQAAPAYYGAGASRGRGGGGGDDASAAYDFLDEPPAVIANLVPDEHGAVHVPAAALGDAAAVTVVVDDPAGAMVRYAARPELPLRPRDLRLARALDPARHAIQRKAIRPLRAGEQLVIEDLATARLHVIDTVERAHAYLRALGGEHDGLRELAFVTRWHELPDHERRALYSKHACHELHLFLYFKDRAFFDGVIAPYLAHKRTKTFLDHWLLDADLTPYLAPPARGRLNAVERALLARRVAARDELARQLADEVALLPPDPEGDARRIDALIGAATLDGDARIAEAREHAELAAEEDDDLAGLADHATSAGMMRGGGLAAPASAAPPPLQAPRKAAKGRADSAKSELARGAEGDDLLDDVARREQAPPPLYRGADQTQEWAEQNWWRRTPATSDASMIEPNRLWRDLALHRDGPFLSPGLGLAAGSLAEVMCALAVTDLPFVAATHELARDGARLVITAASPALVGSSQLVDGELAPGGPPLVVGTSYVRTDDRHAWIDGEQVDKYVDGAFAAGVVYTCQVVLANPSSTRQRVTALVQIPRGAIALAGARATETLDVVLAPYGTHGHEYAFYFPAPGAWSAYPVHVARPVPSESTMAGEAIVAAAPPRTLEVTAAGGAVDPASWAYVSQRGSTADVVAYLAGANLAATDLARAAWRLRERAAYDAIVAALERREAFDEVVWGYALLHRDAPRVRAWLRGLDARLLEAGPVLDAIGLDAEQLGGYEHLEYAPLVDARAHRLGPKRRILNEGLAAQYDRFLELVAHRPAPTANDLLAGAAYLLAQGRVDDARARLDRVHPGELAARMQHDYLVAYVACLTGDLAGARARAEPWRDHPVDRWRHRFGALLAMLDEVDGGAAAPAVLDPRSRDQQHAALAAQQPTFELALDRDGAVIHSRHVDALELRYFEMDIELLFSRQPFVQADVARFSFIEPGHREQVAPAGAEHRVAWPPALRGKNVVVEAVGAGLRQARAHYAHDLATQLAHQVGQLRVRRASDQRPLPATYVKVYARARGGHVAFYKDGYTDPRGWFDYATLSTSELDQVERFAILVCSEQAGATILETNPPAR